MRRSLRAGVVAAAVLTLVTASCGEETAVESLGDGSLGVVEVAPGGAVQVRSVLELEGESGSGPMSEKVVRLAVADYGPIHGFDVELGAPISDGCSPEGGEAAGRAVAADSAVIGVVGTTCSAAAVTAAPLIGGAGMVMISPSNTSPRLTSDLAGNAAADHHAGYYRTSDNDLYQGRTVAQFLRNEKGLGAVAAVHNGDAYTQSLVEAFVDAFEELGGSVTGVGVVPRDETDLVPTLTELAAGAPEALFFPVSRTVGVALVQQLPEVAGLEGVLRISGDGLLADAFLEVPESEGTFVSGPDIDFGLNENQSTGLNAADLLAAFEEAYGTPPQAAFWGHAYDAATLLLAAIEAASRPDGDSLLIDRAGVREYLDTVSDYSGIIGPISCDEFGDCGVQRLVVVHHLDATNPVATRSNAVYKYTP